MSKTDDELVEEYSKHVVDFFNEGGTQQMLHDIPDSAMEQMYLLAYQHYEGNNIDEAEKIFKALCQLNQYETKYFLGLGACRKQKKEYQQALDTFAFVTMFDMENPELAFHCGECCLGLHELEKAQAAFEMSIELSRGKVEHEDIYKKASAALYQVNEQLEK